MRLPYQDIQFSFLIVVFVADRFRSKLRCTWTSRVWTIWFVSIFSPVCTIVVSSSVEMIDNRIDFIAIDCWHFGRNFSNFIASVHPKRTVSWFLRCSNKIYEKNATQNNPHCDPVWEVKSIFRCNLLQFFFLYIYKYTCSLHICQIQVSAPKMVLGRIEIDVLVHMAKMQIVKITSNGYTFSHLNAGIVNLSLRRAHAFVTHHKPATRMVFIVK